MGAVFVTISAAYHNVNLRRLLKKTFEMTEDNILQNLFKILLTNRRFLENFKEREVVIFYNTLGCHKGVLATFVHYLHKRPNTSCMPTICVELARTQGLKKVRRH